LQPKLGYNVERDFAPIGLVGVTPNLLICNESQPAKNVKDLVNLCKQNPGKISFASAGGGSAQHLALEMFKLRAGIDALHVPYKGSGPALTDLIGGQVQYCFETMTSATPHVKSGRLRALAVASLKRAETFPELPTFDESGFPGFEASAWNAVLAPVGTPRDIINSLNAVIVRSVKSADAREKFMAQGAEPVGDSPDQFGVYLRAEVAKWAKVIKASGAKLD
jgi:tripartite-type tricarboxylate transporter receptor subunit TctC